MLKVVAAETLGGEGLQTLYHLMAMGFGYVGVEYGYQFDEMRVAILAEILGEGGYVYELPSHEESLGLYGAQVGAYVCVDVLVQLVLNI